MTPKSIKQTKLVSPTKIDINDSVDFKLPNLERKYIKTMKQGFNNNEQESLEDTITYKITQIPKYPQQNKIKC